MMGGGGGGVVVQAVKAVQKSRREQAGQEARAVKRERERELSKLCRAGNLMRMRELFQGECKLLVTTRGQPVQGRMRGQHWTG